MKRLLLLIWAGWLSVVVATNVADALKALEIIAPNFSFASGNYQAMIDVTAGFGVSPRLIAVLFGGVIAWEAVAALLFWWAAFAFRGVADGRCRLMIAFSVSLALWGAFQIACEVFPSPLAFRIGGVHRLIFTAQLVTLLAMVLLPDESP